jgi:hypothetical protein
MIAAAPPPVRLGASVLNQSTPRVFVAATRQDDGKTTTSLGLFATLRQRFQNIGYIKPVGQRFVEVEGEKIDEDTVLINETYHPRSRLAAMSPIAVEPDFTRRFLVEGNSQDLHRTVCQAFDEASWEKDFVIIEGTGHAGVGSVFDLSNAVVARLLEAKVIIVSRAGVGQPIDEISMNLALFERYGVEVMGVILNKALPDKIEMVRDYVPRGLARLGLPLLGVIPFNMELRKPTLNQVCQRLGGKFLAGADHKRRRVAKVTIGAMSYRNVENYFEPGSLIITAGDRESLILTVLGENASNRSPVAGVVLTSGMLPGKEVLEIMQQRAIPFIATDLGVYEVASAIDQMTVKTEVGDTEKIRLIQKLVTEHVDLDRILDSVRQGYEEKQMRLFETGSFRRLRLS